MSKETSISLDFSSGWIQATDEWWELKIKEKSEYAKFRDKNLEKYTKYYDPLCRGTVAKGDKTMTPATIESNWTGHSLGATFNEEPVGHHVEDIADNDEDPVGDNDEAHVRINDEDIEFPPLSTSTKKEKLKSSDALFKEQIDNVLSVISSRSTATYPAPEVVLGPSIEECHVVMASLPNMVAGSRLWLTASSILMKKEARQTFMLQPTPECKLEWLKFHTEIFLGHSQSK